MDALALHPARLLFGVAMLAMAVPAAAGSSVMPITVDLKQARATGQVTLWNGGDQPMIVQASATAWHQVNGHDVYEPTNDLIIAPAIAEVPPKSGQLFRVRLHDPAPGPERTYRLYLEDITPPVAGHGIAMRIRHDLPVIISSAGGAAMPKVSACDAPADAGCVKVANAGQRLLKVTGITVDGQGWHKQVIATGTVLADGWRQWTFDVPPGAAGPVHVTATTTAGAATADWTLAPR